MSDAQTLAVVIPTRNRADLAIAACNALLAQWQPGIQVVVSDNSTEPEHVERLADFCRRADPSRVSYVRPPAPLAMAAHWDWGVTTALERTNATHFHLHYDRRMFKPHHLRYALELMQRFPDDVVTWTMDQVVPTADGREMKAVWQVNWDGRCYAVRTARVTELTSEGRVVEMYLTYPFLSNCAVPRPVLVDMRQRFGSICNSTAPDSCFTYRFCAVRDRYIYLDRALLVAYAMHRSAGYGYLTGSGSGDFGDFTRALGEHQWLHAAPLPGISLGQNIMYHEYELVRKATHHPAFKPINRARYLKELASCLRFVEDLGVRDELSALLKLNGWDDTEERVGTRVSDGWPWLRRFSRDVIFTLRVALRRWRGRSFTDDAAALRYLVERPLRSVRRNRQLAVLQPVDVSAPSRRRQQAAPARLDAHP